MSISNTLRDYLENQGTQYDLVDHPQTFTSMETAAAAHVPGDKLAKAVVLEDENGYVVSVVPSTNRLDLEWVRETLGRDLEMAEERELRALFQDCALGAVPALSNAYGLDVVWDDQLNTVSDVYIEAGDHEHLVHMKGEAFRQLLKDMPHNIISAEKDYSRWMRD